MTRYLKAIAALIGGVSAWGLTAASDNAIQMAEWFGLVGVLATALAVLAVPNSQEEMVVEPAPDDAGWTELALILLGVVLAIVLLLLFGRLDL